MKAMIFPTWSELAATRKPPIQRTATIPRFMNKVMAGPNERHDAQRKGGGAGELPVRAGKPAHLLALLSEGLHHADAAQVFAGHGVDPVQPLLHAAETRESR